LTKLKSKKTSVKGPAKKPRSKSRSSTLSKASPAGAGTQSDAASTTEQIESVKAEIVDPAETKSTRWRDVGGPGATSTTRTTGAEVDSPELSAVDEDPQAAWRESGWEETDLRELEEAAELAAELAAERAEEPSPTTPVNSKKGRKSSQAVERLPVISSVVTEHLPAAADPVALYMAEIKRYPILTREQEFELAKRYAEMGDAQAAEALVTSNLRFVVKIASEYSKFGARLIDLIQEGNVGLMQAVREYNPYKGVRLITYAVWWIRGYIQEYLMRQYSMVRIGTTAAQRKLFYRLQKEKDRLVLEGQEPTVKLLSSRLGVSEEDVQTMEQRMSARDISLETPIGDDGRVTLLDREASADAPLDEQLGQAELVAILREEVENLRPDLNDRELELLEERLLADEPKTLQEIGERYGVTREAVRQMEARLMSKLRDSLRHRLTR
jgi:RNA polymerase sigma-32 factor